MLPTRSEAEALLKEAEKCNPGPWGNHSRVAAYCAEEIARYCEGLDAEKAYILGLLHDIGRKFGVRHLGHVSDGFVYMMSLGYDEAARVCLTHSFNNKAVDQFIGEMDTTDEELELIQSELDKIDFDDYDRLIQLCDALAGSEGVLNIEARMNDVKARYGYYPQEKWDSNMELKAYFEKKAQKGIYDIVEVGTMRAPFQILAIPYRKTPELRFCVFHRADIDQYQFVAGGGEGTEKPLDSAIREIREETGAGAEHVTALTSMAYIPANVIAEKHRKFWSRDTYVIPEYAFAFECDTEISISAEHLGFAWLRYEEAMQRLTWDSNKTALYELNCRLLAE